LQSPPPLPRATPGGAATQLMFMLPMMLMMGVMSFSYIGRSGNGPMTIVFGALYAGVMVFMVVGSIGRGSAGRKSQLNEERRDYLRYLASLRKQVRQNSLRQRTALLLAHPEPESLVSLATGERVWERRPTDDDFAHVRIGTGPQRLSTALRPPQTAPVEDLDPVTSTSLRHFIRTYVTLPELPVALSLRGFSRVTLVGGRSVVLDMARAMIGQVVTFHSAETVRVALCLSASRLADWDWAKWLPHLRHPDQSGPSGPQLLVAPDLNTLEDLLATELSGRGPFDPTGRNPVVPHVLVVLDGGDTRESRMYREGGMQAVTVLDLDAAGLPVPYQLRLVAEAGRLGTESDDGIEYLGAPDRLSAAQALALARQLAPLPGASSTPGDDGSLNMHFGLPEMLAMGDPRDMDATVLARLRNRRDRLRIPLGLDDRGMPLELDLKESAENGMGPHGLVIGATGSGKSELLRTLVMALAVTHSSETLNFVLVDFKGGATFAGLEVLPHTSAVITNLADDLLMVDRAQDAMHGELIRRQELLRKAGNYASARDYERARAAGTKLEPLPSLLILIDEFSELLTSKPEFIEVFVTIGRLGRSLGVHLLLASQRLEEGRLRGLDSHLSYRIGLRTFSAAESRTVLGTPAAYELPSVPGSAYLRFDTTNLVRFKAAYVSGPLPPRITSTGSGPAGPGHQPVPFALDRSAARVQAASNSPDPAPVANNSHVEFADTVLGAIVLRLKNSDSVPAHQVWLPPLADPPTLNQMLPQLGVDPQRGLCPVGWPGNGRLAVPVGIVDMPFEQRRDLLWADFSAAGGNGIIVGGPRSGKSTLVRTLVSALALTCTPLEAQVYCLDFGGGSLATLEKLPHVGGVAAARDPDRVVRAVAEVNAMLGAREAAFAELGIDSMATAREHRDPHGRQVFADVFLVIDGWITFREKHENLEEVITSLTRRGLGYGIHVIVAANRWMDVRPAMRDLLGTRLELRLGDPSDSEIDRRTAMRVPEGIPGRGITKSKHHFLTGLPRVDGRSTVDGLAAGFEDLARGVAQSWRGPVAPPVRMLPLQVPLDELPQSETPGLLVPFGLAEVDLGPVYLDFGTDPHMVILGDTESGKTNALHAIALGLSRWYRPEQARIVMADYRRGLLGTITTPHLLGHAGGEAQLTPMIGEIAEGLRRRMPGPDITPEQLRARSWWQGPEMFLLVDDYDLVATGATNPLAPLVEMLPHARDVGLHLIVARRSGGAGRAMFDPVLARMRELASPALVLSADKEEGVLFGIRAQQRPPGRGEIITRRHGIRLIQVATVEQVRSEDSAHIPTR
jgi:S-DNA-T family DNA segregation ATPase FtsK/SpoIIIE